MVDESVTTVSTDPSSNTLADAEQVMESSEENYNAIVLDTSALIHSSGNLHTYTSKSTKLYTVPGVLTELRDSKSRTNLEANLLTIREPSKASLQVIINFSKKSGDYPHLSLVDLQLIALTYELECEGVGGDLGYLRFEPKHVIGKGYIEMMGREKDKEEVREDHVEDGKNDSKIDIQPIIKPQPGGSWAHIVNPAIASHSIPITEDYTKILSQVNLNEDLGGQFSDAEDELEKELKLDFPSLSASLATADYSDEEPINPLDPTSDKRYNTFNMYRDVITPNGVTNTKKTKVTIIPEEPESEPTDSKEEHTSRIMGGTAISGQTAYEDDDDEGWITVDTLQSLKSSGSIPFSSIKKSNETKASNKTPPKSQRTAIVTTDYAMQNIILQMNLLLLSLNASTTITQLKSWILRCQACFLLLPTQNEDEKIPRIFCPKCGNAHTLQRISAKVNANTGRLILFRTKNPKKINGTVRGMKYSIPKPTPRNRFNGELLTREDQLLYGIWKQKLKTNSVPENEIFGSDILDSVGLSDRSKKKDFGNIHAGFGRRNVNATKNGRERRGKKKKGGSDKIVCGMRRTC